MTTQISAPAVSDSHPPHLAIVGGGITGLSAALHAIENGQDPAGITVYEASQRLGGKIQSTKLSDGTVVNNGAEFIDSDHEQLIALCGTLGVKLIKAEDQEAEAFQGNSGIRMTGDAFHAAFAPIMAQIRRDKAAVLAEPKGLFAQQLNKMTMPQYLESLRAQTPVEPHPSFFRRIAHLFTGNKNRVSPEITEIALHAYASEIGQSPENSNALQYLHEAGVDGESFLASDCAWRVEGGTEKLIEALSAKLREKGVKFQQGAPLVRLSKESAGIGLHFTGSEQPVHADKLLLAVPAYALGNVQGLDRFGLNANIQQFIGQTQYTDNAKLTIKLKPGIPAPKENFFGNGFQAWSAGEGQMTFLLNADKMQEMGGAPQLIQSALNSYAATFGSSADAMFDRSPGNVVFANPGAKPCYASPAPGKAQQLELLNRSLDAMADNNIAIAGTYLPYTSPKGSIGIGFMECGMASARHSVELLLPKQQEKAPFIQNIIAQGPVSAQGYTQQQSDAAVVR